MGLRFSSDLVVLDIGVAEPGGKRRSPRREEVG